MSKKNIGMGKLNKIARNGVKSVSGGDQSPGGLTVGAGRLPGAGKTYTGPTE